ncbi:hypothetical protein [Pseudomonas donghuensis]|uniref:hypothetical protein n=1 Tax=Pseudomonas donghuensis TaxID=1163398 RepID=UPI000C2A9BE5|nr:hypothetical protein [Pseudomonas donghuensis]PJY97693.1 hypothetical protein COO64_06255 [Pseudomonas donghuensis]WKY26958.1 hypothetical protein QYF67_18980 [Pseudomonas donghuensis]
MAQYSFINLVKREAKAYQKSKGVSLAQAQEHIARDAGFAHYHEMVSVSKSNPYESRLMLRALGVEDFESVLYLDSIWYGLDHLVQDLLNGPIAETNAMMFTVENMDVASADYDDESGLLILDVYFEYHGEQDEDRPWCGNEFYIDAKIKLVFREGWEFSYEAPLVIAKVESDRDLDREAEMEYLDDKQKVERQELDMKNFEWGKF